MGLDGTRCDESTKVGAAGLETTGIGIGLIISDIVLLPVVLLIATRCGPPT